MEAWAVPIRRAILEQLGGRTWIPQTFVTFGIGVDGFFTFKWDLDNFATNHAIVVHL